MSSTPASGWPGAPPPDPAAAPQWQPPARPPLHAQSQPTPPWQTQPWQSPPGPAPSGFDPTRAFGTQRPDSVSISQFSPPPNRTPLLITLAALITLVLVIAGGSYLKSLPPTQPTPSGPSAPAPGHPFTTPDGRQSGRWEILRSQWTDEGLQLQLRIGSDQGPIQFSFMAFSNNSTQIVNPTSSPITPDIKTGTATPDRPVTGYLFLPISRGDATIILANGSGRQMSALAVKG